jgi:hypothetical protein
MASNDQTTNDAIIYMGYKQDSIPRAIWFDPALQGIDVRAWGLIRTQLDADNPVTISLHSFLRRQLGHSKATVSRILYVLRLSRWITLCHTLRNAAGHKQGHVYAIHDHALSITDTFALDPNYLDFVNQQTKHGYPYVRQLAESILGGVQQAQVQKLNLGNPKVQYLNLGESKVQLLNLGTISEDQKNQSDTAKVQKLNLGLTTCSSSLLKTTTTSKNPRARENDFHFPPSLTSAEITLALSRLDQLPAELRQAFLDETAAQIERKRQTQRPIRNPIGFLDWLCSEYSQGNNRLTSLSVRYQEQRQMQQQIENTADQSVQTFEAELKQSTPKPTASKNNQNRKSRWGDLNL